MYLSFGKKTNNLDVEKSFYLKIGSVSFTLTIVVYFLYYQGSNRCVFVDPSIALVIVLCVPLSKIFVCNCDKCESAAVESKSEK